MIRRKVLLPMKRLHRSTLCPDALRAMSSAEQLPVDGVKARPFEEIPGPRGIYQWPVIGSLLNYKPFTKFTTETLPDLLNQIQDTYGSIVKVRLGGQVVLVSDPKDFETVYRNEGKYPVRPGLDLIEIYNKRNNIPNELPLLQGPDWHAKRSILNKRLMKADSATHYLEQQNDVADDFVKVLDSQKLSPEELEELFFRFASESIAVVTFNKRLGLFNKNPDQDAVDFLEANKTGTVMLQDALFGKSIAHKWYRNSTYRTFEASQAIIRRVAIKYIQEAQKVVEDKIRDGTFDENEPNLLHSLLSERSLTTQDISGAMTALYGGGTDSTAKNLQVLFYNLAKNPEKQENLRREILEVLGHDKPLTAKSLSKLVYLKAALKESFRLNFPVPVGNLRILPTDVVLSGYTVPAGIPVLLFNKRTSKTHFEDPDQFLPERWLRSEENTKKDSAHSMIVLPFGHGIRNCIGRRFAVQEIYLATAKVLQKLRIDVLPESANVKLIYKTFIQPEKPINFKFTAAR
ncbi:hypothetical protein Btru_073201 [Bulinus truncatus]|nr:hypothetical protein Btru_073201 [Bulinus truncatus]